MSDTASRRVRADAKRNMQRVLAAAGELFATNGMDVTLNGVARHAGVGVGTVYRRFPSIEHLVEAIFAERIADDIALAETALQHENSWEGLVWFIERHCELTATNRALREIVYSRAYSGDRVEDARKDLLPLVHRLVERARQDGHLRHDIVHCDIPVLGLLAGIVSQWAGPAHPELWRRFVALILEGMRQRPNIEPIGIEPLDEKQLHSVMHGWNPRY